MDPLLSIVTGTRNRPQALQAFLASVAAHTTHSYEVLIGDASDRTGPVRSSDPRVRVFPEPEPLGYVCGYNRLFGQARGRYVCYLNDDTEVCAGWSDSVLDVFERSPEVDLACFPVVEEEGPLILLFCGIPFACMGAVRREAGERVGWFDEGYGFYAADPDFSMRLIAAGLTLAPVARPVVLHHLHADDERVANQALLKQDNARLLDIWHPRRKELQRKYRKSSRRHFRGFETIRSAYYEAKVLRATETPENACRER